jgi:hypothetical protein
MLDVSEECRNRRLRVIVMEGEGSIHFVVLIDQFCGVTRHGQPL